MRSKSKVPARQRLLEAAERVIARDGLSRATTKAIALDAGVSEITLFRLFGCKDHLVGEVIGHAFPDQDRGAALLPHTDDLAADLRAYCKLHEDRMHENMGMVRSLIGAVHVDFREHQREAFLRIFRPLRAALISRLETAQASGQLRCQTEDPLMLADLLHNMLTMDSIRRSVCEARPAYTRKATVECAIRMLTADSPARHPGKERG